MLRSLQESLAVLSNELVPVHERLVNLRRQLVALAARETASQAAQKAAQEELAALSPPIPVKSVNSEETPDADTDPSKTPTKEVPNPEQLVPPKLKAELKPLQEELRRIDSLSVCVFLCL